MNSAPAAARPRKLDKRTVYELRDDGQLDVFTRTKSGQRTRFDFTVRLDEPSTRYRVPALVLRWAQRQKERVIMNTQSTQSLRDALFGKLRSLQQALTRRIQTIEGELRQLNHCESLVELSRDKHSELREDAIVFLRSVGTHLEALRDRKEHAIAQRDNVTREIEGLQNAVERIESTLAPAKTYTDADVDEWLARR